MGLKYETFTISGSVENGFENVRNLFARNFADNTEDKATLCVYHQGRKVVDLSGFRHVKADVGFPYNEDSLHLVFSSSKSVTAIVVAKLVEEGRIAYEDRVADHWPEFAVEGKADITVADVLRHDAGLAAFQRAPRLSLRDFFTRRIKENAIGRVVEMQKPSRLLLGDGRNVRVYHAITRDLILNELVRRTDSKGRTVGEFIREEIRDKHVGCDVFCGEDVKERVARMTYVPPWTFALKLFLPRWQWLDAIVGDEAQPSALDIYRSGRPRPKGKPIEKSLISRFLSFHRQEFGHLLEATRTKGRNRRP